MPKLVVKVDHTKTKKKIQKENKILVKEKNEDRHVGFKAYGDDGETGGTKLGKNGIVEWRADTKQEAAKKQQAKEKKIYDADHKGKEHAGDNKFIQNFDKNASKGLRTIQVGAKSPNEAPDHDAEGAALAAKADAIADRHHAEDARMKAEREAAKAQREADALADKKRITFRRSMNMRHGSVRWKRMTAVVGHKGSTDVKTRDTLLLHFQKIGKGKTKLTRKDIGKFFHALNGKQFIAQFERYYKGTDAGDARRYHERDVYKMVAELCGEEHPDEWAMIYAFRDVGGYELDCVKHRHLRVNDAAQFLEAYTERRKFQEREKAKRRGPIGHTYACIMGLFGPKDKAKYLL
ncbi:hypothetical protein JL720_8430 [Aureococcus anophagefferens]|nr:hypothetical protein JL720_8430 [Aureococcus anophagefferens]